MAYMSGIHLSPVIYASSPTELAMTNHYHKTLMNNASWLAAEAAGYVRE